RLPRTGKSKPQPFVLRTAPEPGPVAVRILVLHRNRVLQTAILTGSAVVDPAAAPSGNRIVLEVESVVHARLDDLDVRRPFDVALVMNHQPGGREGMTAVTAGKVVVKSLGTTATYAASVRTLLEDAVLNRSTRATLRDAEVRELLFNLAQAGVQLYKFVTE